MHHFIMFGYISQGLWCLWKFIIPIVFLVVKNHEYSKQVSMVLDMYQHGAFNIGSLLRHGAQNFQAKVDDLRHAMDESL